MRSMPSPPPSSQTPVLPVGSAGVYRCITACMHVTSSVQVQARALVGAKCSGEVRWFLPPPEPYPLLLPQHTFPHLLLLLFFSSTRPNPNLPFPPPFLALLSLPLLSLTESLCSVLFFFLVFVLNNQPSLFAVVFSPLVVAVGIATLARDRFAPASAHGFLRQRTRSILAIHRHR